MMKRIVGLATAILLALALTPAVAQATDGTSAAQDGSSAAEAIAPEVQPTGVEPAQTCAAGDLCFWSGFNYTGARGRVAGNNTNWAAFPQSACSNNNWSNCASSIRNNGTQCTAYQYALASYGGASMFLLRGAQNSDLRTTVSAGNWNNRISSNRWCSPA